MNLLDYIRYHAENCDLGTGSREKIEQVGNSLKRFLDGKEIDLLQTAVPGWSDDYYDYLVNEFATKRGNVGEKQAKQLWKLFRGTIRTAVKAGMYPDIEIEPDRLFQSRKGAIRRPSKVSITSQLNKLQDTSKVSSNKWLERYAAALRLGGMEIQDLMNLLSTGGAEEASVLLPHFGVEVHIDPKMLSDIAIASPDGSADSPSGKRSDSSEIVSTSLEVNGINLYKAGNVFTDWLCHIKENGTPDSVIRELIKLRFDTEKISSPVLEDEIRQLVESRTQPKSGRDDENSPNWYAVMTIGRTPEEVMAAYNGLMDHIEDLKAGRAKPEASEEWMLSIEDDYASPDYIIPYDKTKARNDNQLKAFTSALNRIMFVRISAKHLPIFARLISNAWIYNYVKDDKKVYCKVLPQEIIRMRRVLNFLANYEDGKDWLFDDTNDTYDDLKPGDKVRIEIPGYETYDVVVEREVSDKDRRQVGKGADLCPNERSYYLLFNCKVSFDLKLPFPRHLLKKLRV